MNPVARLTCALLLALPGASAAAPPGAILLSSAPPEEFAELLRPQKTIVDIWFAGERVGSTLAEYTPDTLRFINPQDVVNGIPNVVNRNLLLNHLTGELARNSEVACTQLRTENCGKLDTEFADIIFDEARFRVDVFVHPDLLLVSGSTATRHLPDARADGPALVQNINAVVSQDSTGVQRHNLAGLTWVSHGMQRVFSQWSDSDGQGLTVQELAWQRDTHEHEYTAGLFQSRADALSLTRSEYLAGGGFGRSFKTRTDLEYMRGTEITVFLPTRSQVEILKDNRLLSSRIYNAGNVRLDTSRLPAGAYDIDIRIRGIDGALRTLTRTFVKSNRMAPPGEPLYYVEGGQIVGQPWRDHFPSSLDAWQLRAGYQSRHSDVLAWNAGGAATDTHALLEGGASYLQPRYELSALLGMTTQGDYGNSASAALRAGKGSITLYHRETRRTDPPTMLDYQLIAAEDARVAVSLSWPLLGGQALASAEKSRNLAGDVETRSLRWLRTLAGLGPFTTTLASEIAESNGDVLAQLSLSISRSGRHFSGGGSLGAQHSETAGIANDAFTGNAQVGWSDGDWRPEDIEASLHASGDDRSTVTGFDALHASQYGRLAFEGEKVDVSGGISGMRAAASYDTNFVARRDGIAFGGNELAPAAVILDLRGGDTRAEFDVLVDGQKMVAVRSGNRAVLPLSAYRTYRIQLLDRGLAFVAFDDTPREVTLYPGTVETLAWDIRPIRVAIGRVRQPERVCSETSETCEDMDVPVRNAVIQGAWGFGMTDEQGRFQVELVEETRTLSVTRGGHRCDVELPLQPPVVNGIAKLGDLVCRMLPLSGADETTGPAP